LDASVFLPFLKMGEMLSALQSTGTTWFWNELIKIIFNAPAISCLTSYKILECIPSGPGDLLISLLSNLLAVQFAI